MSKYSEALENREKVKFIQWKTHDEEGNLHLEDVVPVSDVDVIEQALRIADRLEQEKVTSSVLRQGFKVLEENYDGIDSSRMGIQGFGRAVEEVFRQFLKEEENNDTV